jgi:hypothetical protein
MRGFMPNAEGQGEGRPSGGCRFSKTQMAMDAWTRTRCFSTASFCRALCCW